MSEFVTIFLDSGLLAASGLGVYSAATFLHPVIGHLASVAGIGILSLFIGLLLPDLMDKTIHSFGPRVLSG